MKRPRQKRRCKRRPCKLPAGHKGPCAVSQVQPEADNLDTLRLTLMYYEGHRLEMQAN